MGIRLSVLFLGVLLTWCPILSKAQDGNVTFSYQGRVKVTGQAFNGTGLFKLSILNTPGNATLWSQDGTGTGENSPTGSISLPVSDGVFN